MTDYDDPLGVYYLSFGDPDVAATIPKGEARPGGPSWLGGCYVKAADPVMAASVAWDVGCNPGGAAMILGPFPCEAIKPEYLDRLLLSQGEVNAAWVDP